MIDWLMSLFRHCTHLLIAILFLACSPRKFITKSLKESSDQLHNHTGFVLYDPLKKETLVSFQGDKYFTPASNTKIFTLYAGLKILGDSVPALRWISRSDSLIFWGTGDPSFLYPNVFQNQKVLNFLQNRPEKLIFSDGNFFENAYGPGWAWDDSREYFQAERSSFPVYGNLISLSKNRGLQPTFFQSNFREDTIKKNALNREQFSNKLSINKNKIASKGINVVPFITSSTLTAQLLADTLNREVVLSSKPMEGQTSLLYSIPADSLYKVMMKASDNFIAEQTLLMCAQKVSDSLNTKIAIDKVIKDFLNDLPDAPVWVDGSGLSRYNQFTPRTITKLWEKIYETIPQQRLFPLLATNGQPGTIKNFLPKHPPIIFGKSGGLANNYCLSGYLVTRKKRLLIFSSMNANVVPPTRNVRSNLEKILTYVYEKY